jgi:surfeit locus 1 family protein
MRVPFKETLMTGICVSILCGLGTWQVQRLHWKNEIISGLEDSYSKGRTQELSRDMLVHADSGKDVFAYGHARGHFLRDKAVLVGPRIVDGRSGYYLLVPMTMDGDSRPLIVNTGWVSDMWNDTLDERLALLPADVTVRGLVRHPDWSSFTSKNSPANNLWFRPDPVEIAMAKDLKNPYGIILYADQIDPPLQDVIANEDHWLPRNKHLQYALFWYALALAMLGVYGFYVRQQKTSAAA